MLIDDVAKVIGGTNEFHKDKQAEAALFLFAMLCGARSITCKFIRLCDIVHVSFDETTSFYRVRVCIVMYLIYQALNTNMQ